MFVLIYSHAYHMTVQIMTVVIRGEHAGLDITDITFEINLINRSKINPKDYSQYDQQIQDKQCLKEDMTLPGCNIIELSKDRELVQTKETLKDGKASQLVYSKYIILDDTLYYLSKADTGPIIRLYVPEQFRK